jgi:hypothetical protein
MMEAERFVRKKRDLPWLKIPAAPDGSLFGRVDRNCREMAGSAPLRVATAPTPKLPREKTDEQPFA